MALTTAQKQAIKTTITTSLRNKFVSHNPEPAYMPFHTGLLGKDRYALYKFIHSLNTNFGTSIFEPVAITIAAAKFSVAKKQAKLGQKISADAQIIIQNIINKLTSASIKPHKEEEIIALRKVCQSGEINTIKTPQVDIYLENDDGIYLFDIKTAKPNKDAFKSFKRTLLEWVAVILYENPNAKINSLIAIPYNPYAPNPYSRWTMAGMLDLPTELKVAEEFWDFLGGENTYNDLLHCFEVVGVEMRDEIDTFFAKFNDN